MSRPLTPEELELVERLKDYVRDGGRLHWGDEERAADLIVELAEVPA